jgi:hypothetical protein
MIFGNCDICGSQASVLQGDRSYCLPCARKQKSSQTTGSRKAGNKEEKMKFSLQANPREEQ